MSLFKKSQERIDADGESDRKGKLLASLVFFPGSIEEYERFKGYSVEIVDTERPDKGLTCDHLENGFIIYLMDTSRVEALVNVCSKSSGHTIVGAHPYGLPVRRKL